MRPTKSGPKTTVSVRSHRVFGPVAFRAVTLKWLIAVATHNERIWGLCIMGTKSAIDGGNGSLIPLKSSKTSLFIADSYHQE